MRRITGFRGFRGFKGFKGFKGFRGLGAQILGLVQPQTPSPSGLCARAKLFRPLTTAIRPRLRPQLAQKLAPAGKGAPRSGGCSLRGLELKNFRVSLNPKP